MKPEDAGKKPSDNVPVLNNRFQAIVQLLQLLIALLSGPGEHKHQSDNRTGDSTRNLKSRAFDFVDAITNLMVRNDEVVAGVACASQSQGIISLHPPNETPCHENAQPAPVDTGMESEEMELSSDFYDDSSDLNNNLAGAYLRVATVANSRFYQSKDFKGVPDSVDFKSLTPDSETSLWMDLRKCKPEDVCLWIRRRPQKISLQDHMRIIESYLNEYKQGSTKLQRNLHSNIMLKYIVGSCFKKMSRRAFHWASSFMIKQLTDLKWESIPKFSPVPVKSDQRLADFLRMKNPDIERDSDQSYGEWLMTFFSMSSSGSGPGSLDVFLTRVSGSPQATYDFDHSIAATFHNLLLSSLYFYLCSIARLKYAKEESEIRSSVGFLCNAIRLFFLVSQSNAMKAYFTHPSLPVYRPTKKISDYYTIELVKKIRSNFVKLGWDTQAIQTLVDGDEDQDSYMDSFNDSPDAQFIYRKALMSFVDHYTGLLILQRRSTVLPADETIRLSLVAVRHPTLYYRSWEDMKTVINQTCKEFSTSDRPLDHLEVIQKIENTVTEFETNDKTDGVILAFKALLINSQPGETQPIFKACIHCESSLIAILSMLHGLIKSYPDLDQSLRDFFQITDACLTTPVIYSISVSKFCCPVCWELVKALNEMSSTVQFAVHAYHSNIYPVCLPTWLPEEVLEKMIKHFGKALHEKLRQLLQPFTPGHSKSYSFESTGKSVSSYGSTDVGAVWADQQSASDPLSSSQ